jgi:dihydroorotase
MIRILNWVFRRRGRRRERGFTRLRKDLIQFYFRQLHDHFDFAIALAPSTNRLTKLAIDDKSKQFGLILEGWLDLRFPGLIDAHVHLRSPGGEHKENFRTGSMAGLAGGFTTLLAMPNTQPPLISHHQWNIAQNRAKNESLCDVFLYAGASSDTIDQLPRLAKHAHALKIYMNDTYGPLCVDDLVNLRDIIRAWPAGKPIAVHAEGDSVAVALSMAALYQRAIHFCHVSRKIEIELIADAKARKLNVTCEVTPHHLFFTEADAARLGPLGDVRPLLATQEDVDALWCHINTTIDCVASDHAPHLLSEKGLTAEEHAQNLTRISDRQGKNLNTQHPKLDAPPPGIPGLESTLPLMLTAAAKGRLSYDRILSLLYTNPRRIYQLPEQPETWVEVDEHSTYTFPDHPLYTKCAWSPFKGYPMTGRITKVVFKGREVFSDGRFIL